MTRRTELYDALMGHSGLQAIVDGRVASSGSLNNVPTRPFVLIRMHNAYRFGRNIGRRDIAQIWCHDEPGDYMIVDEMMGHCREAIESIVGVDQLCAWEWIEDSVDLKDDDMHTVTRNARYQATSTTPERQ